MNSHLIEKLASHFPCALIPTVIPVTPGAALKTVNPGKYIEIPGWDPIRTMSQHPAPNGYLTGTATESGGAASVAITPTNEIAFANVLQFEVNPNREENGIANALVTLTCHDFNDVAEQTNDAEAAGVTTTGVTTNAAFSFRFSCGPDATQKFFIHLAKRPSGYGVTVPMTAVLRETSQGTNPVITSDWDLNVVTTDLVSASGVETVATVITPGTTEWEDYCAYMLKHFYKSAAAA